MVYVTELEKTEDKIYFYHELEKTKKLNKAQKKELNELYEKFDLLMDEKMHKINCSYI